MTDTESSIARDVEIIADALQLLYEEMSSIAEKESDVDAMQTALRAKELNNWVRTLLNQSHAR